MYAIALMYSMHCGAAVAVLHGGLVVGNATDVMASVYVFLTCGCIADGYVQRVDAFRRIGAIMLIVEGCADV